MTDLGPEILGILDHRLRAVADEMAGVIQRTAVSLFVKETQDLACGVSLPTGEICAFPSNAPAMMLGGNCSWAVESVGTMGPEDIGITNDPVSSRGWMTHLNDVHLFQAYMPEGVPVLYLWAFLHLSDIGGGVPGSITATARDRWSEGFCIPPMLLYSDGHRVDPVWDLLLANSRTPDQCAGDISALIAAVRVGRRRLDEIVERYGLETLVEGSYGLVQRAETRAREIFGKLPRGTVATSDYVEMDEAGSKARIQLHLSNTNSGLHLDFSGSDGEVDSPYNLATGGVVQGELGFGIVNFLKTIEGIPMNGGMLRAVTATLPGASIMNPNPDRAVGVRMPTVIRIMEMINAALGQLGVTSSPAASGDRCLAFLTVDDPVRGKVVSLLQPLIGGSGASQIGDGVDGRDLSVAWLRNVPSEQLEAELPIWIREYRLAATSAAGRFRGGRGVTFEFEMLADQGTLHVRNRARVSMRPWAWGLGEPGGILSISVIRADGTKTWLRFVDQLVLYRGDVVRFTSGYGAGFGDPLERPPEAVGRDVRGGVLSPNDALVDYGVICDRNGSVDDLKTNQLRDVVREERESLGLFDRDNDNRVNTGIERPLLEAGLGVEAVIILAKLADAIPAPLRQNAEYLLLEKLKERPKDKPAEALLLSVNEWIKLCDATIKRLSYSDFRTQFLRLTDDPKLLDDLYDLVGGFTYEDLDRNPAAVPIESA